MAVGSLRPGATLGAPLLTSVTMERSMTKQRAQQRATETPLCLFSGIFSPVFTLLHIVWLSGRLNSSE